ncbi:hypothetical protein KKB64_03275, partial [Patescibacteria group bacterium]|nr:hypothetical protein [Patescibacteria group bacterium]MBU1472781.1 hypothetical protein [Patescibacteria group bacterium]
MDNNKNKLVKVCNVCLRTQWKFLFTSRDRLFNNDEVFTVKCCYYCGLVKLFPQPTPEKLN